MKFSYFFLLFVVCVIEINGFARDRRQLGRVPKCEEGTHIYASSCGGVTTWSEPTCDEPEAQDMGAICDLVSCYCDSPNIKDTSTGACVAPENCPKKKLNK